MRVEMFKTISYLPHRMTTNKSLRCGMNALAQWCVLGLFALCLVACNKSMKSFTQPNERDSLHDSLRTCFVQARQSQLAGNNSKAIAHFKRCLAIDSPDTLTQLELQPLVLDAMLQMLNSYQAAALNKECVDAFNQLHANPTHVIKNYCWRDLHTLLAYATLFAGNNQPEAEHLILESMKMPLKGAKTAQSEDSDEERNLTAEREFRDYSYAAAICYNNTQRQDDVIGWCKKAIEVAKQCDETSGSQYVLSMLSSLYMKRGQVVDAINLSIASMNYAEEINDTLSYVNACNVLARIYHEIQMPELSNWAASEAVECVSKCSMINPMIAAQAYLSKSNALFTLKHNDECLPWWKKANALTQKMPYNNGQCDVDFAYAAYLINRNKKAEMPQAIQLLEKVTHQGTASIKARAYHYLARAYELQGNDALCEAMLDSMYAKEHATNPPIFARRANDFAISHYLRTHNAVMVARYTADQQKENENLRSQAVIQRVVNEMVSKRLAKDRMEEEKVRSQMKLQKAIHISLISLLAAAVVYIFFLLIKRRRKHRHEMLEIIHIAQKQKKELAQVTQKLEVARSKADRQGELLRLSDSLTTETAIRKFEVLFDKYFPTFSSTVKELAPGLGRKEHLTCLLLYLGLNSTQIANSLGVTARTITVYRYRLRQKLNLGSETLDEFLARMGKKD